MTFVDRTAGFLLHQPVFRMAAYGSSQTTAASSLSAKNPFLGSPA
jgi:hypothetical protein